VCSKLSEPAVDNDKLSDTISHRNKFLIALCSFIISSISVFCVHFQIRNGVVVVGKEFVNSHLQPVYVCSYVVTSDILHIKYQPHSQVQKAISK
jgi:hypothetical protein